MLYIRLFSIFERPKPKGRTSHKTFYQNLIEMKKQLLRGVILLLFILQSSWSIAQGSSTLPTQLKLLYGVTSVEPVKSEQYSEKYEVFIEQPLDYADTTKGKFSQRFFVAHVGYDRPTVIVTEGYSADYAANPKYREELSKLFNANLVFVEHRYFSKSTPKNADWKYLTAEASANDLHRINKALKSIYKGKWISTGISKGGQTTMLYRTFFPDDVDISVPYVAPLNFGEEDGRHEPFIANTTGTEEGRKKVQDFQLEVLKRRSTLQPMFDSLCAKEKFAFKAPLEEIYDYCVLEYSFSLWQWGTPTDKIPALNAPDSIIFKHFVGLSSPDYFQYSGPTVSFFVQAAKELGYYGYDIKPFKKHLKIKSAKGYLRKLMIPEGSADKFDATLAKRIQKYLNNNDPKMIFIYGEWDPWSSVSATFKGEKQNMAKYVQPKGNHRARIATLPDPMKKEVMEKLNKWLEE